jgi:hypothetical protein
MAEEEEELQLPEAPGMDDPKVRALIKILFGVDISQLTPEIALDLKEQITKKIQDIMEVVLAFIPITGKTLTEEFIEMLPSIPIPEPPDVGELVDNFENSLPEVEEPEPPPPVTEPVDYNPTDDAELANALNAMEREGLDPSDYFG